MTNITLPKKITPCPILEAIVEIRFDSPFPPDAIYGVAYNAFKGNFPKTQSLPILQLPEPIRLQDPALRFKPYYKFTNSGFIFQIGPKVCLLSSIKEYVGWTAFLEKIKDSFERIFKLEIIEKVTRLGIRYINSFESEDIFNKVNLKILMGSDPLKSERTIIRTAIKSGKFVNNLQVSNKVILNQGGKTQEGSIIDIDVITTDIPQKDIKNVIIDLIEEGHYEEKKLFFALLKKNFLATLNPEY
jgi:uncharacterized protein (TIGR04255 family)